MAPGRTATIKPNISAPGVNVRSSIPGSSYGSYQRHLDGRRRTSRAPSRCCGRPRRRSSVTSTPTRALLNGTAIDKADSQCGGTAADNNVYGEGRLDALALLNAAPIGDIGTLAGTVTDAATGAPIAGATVTLTGPAGTRGDHRGGRHVLDAAADR